MKLRLFEVAGIGELQGEYVGIIADKRCLASNYCLVTCRFNEDKVRFRQPSIFQLPRLRLEGGDEIRVWTKSRAWTVQFQTDGRRLDELGWGLRRPIWNDQQAGVVLQEVRAFQAIQLVGADLTPALIC